MINGGEKGGLLQTIREYKSSPELLSDLTPESVFLDYATGDFYSFDKYECLWKPKGNVGMHYSKAVEGSQKMIAGRELVSKTQVYRAQATPSNTALFA